MKLSYRERRFLIWTARRCRQTALNQLIKILPKSITINTTRSYLARAGIHRLRARRKPFLKKVHMNRRLSWCKERRHWLLEDWRIEVKLSGQTSRDLRSDFMQAPAGFLRKKGKKIYLTAFYLHLRVAGRQL